MRRILALACASAALAYLLVYLVIAILRIAYPYELEWQEGGVLDHVRRVLDGVPIYAAPSLDFIAFPYPPFFYWVAALATQVAGVSFAALRAVSIAGSLACFALLYFLAARSSGSRLGGIFAAGLYAATYRFAGAWFDVARVDSLFLALVLGGVAVARERRGATWAVIAALCFFAAYFTKQAALVVAAPVCAALVVQRRAEGAWFTAVLALAVFESTSIMNGESGGWYSWYVFDLLAGHAWRVDAALGFLWEIAVTLGPAIALAVWAAWLARHDHAPDQHRLFDACVVAGLAVAAWISRAHVGGYDNTLMPACAAIAWCFGRALVWLLARGGRTAPIAASLAILQFALLWYSPRAQLPSERDREAGASLVAEIGALPGEVFLPHHGYLAQAAGKAGSAHAMAIIDVLQGADHDVAGAFVKELEAALVAHRYAAIILDEPWEEDLPLLEESYRPVKVLFDAHDGLFHPVTGDFRRPLIVYLPRDAK